MAFWLRSEERRVAARGRRVRGDVTAVDTARRELAAGLRRELGRPKVLLGLFAAGLGVGWLRRREAKTEALVRDEEPRGGRFAKLVAAVLAGARIYEQLRHAAAFVERTGADARAREAVATPAGAAGSAAFRDDATYPVEEHEAHERY